MTVRRLVRIAFVIGCTSFCAAAPSVFAADTYNLFGGQPISTGVGVIPAFFDALREFGLIDAACVPAVPLTIIPSHGPPHTLAEALVLLAGGFAPTDVGCP